MGMAQRDMTGWVEEWWYDHGCVMRLVCDGSLAMRQMIVEMRNEGD